jgi:hypothetical protein
MSVDNQQEGQPRPFTPVRRVPPVVAPVTFTPAGRHRGEDPETPDTDDTLASETDTEDLPASETDTDSALGTNADSTLSDDTDSDEDEDEDGTPVDVADSDEDEDDTPAYVADTDEDEDEDAEDTETTDVRDTDADGIPAVTAETAPAPVPVPVPAPAPALDTESDSGDAAVSMPGTSAQPESRSDWQRIQASFVDDPRTSVAEAATMVEDAVAAIQQRGQVLRDAWEDNGTDTEKLRVAFRDYRSLYEKLNGL